MAASTTSLLTRLLAVYGLPALLFVFYLVSRLQRLARERDVWACACFPALLLLIMQWGNIYHPTSAIGGIFFLIIALGWRAFTGTREAKRPPQTRAHESP